MRTLSLTDWTSRSIAKVGSQTCGQLPLLFSPLPSLLGVAAPGRRSISGRDCAVHRRGGRLRTIHLDRGDGGMRRRGEQVRRLRQILR